MPHGAARIVSVPRPERMRPPVVHERLHDSCITERTRALAETLAARIVGQEAVVEALTCSFSRLLGGLRDPDRPALTLLLLGPTGVGKTETARALAYALFGSEKALTQVDCEEYAHGHEVSKLLGAPPGYLGHGLEPLLSQRRLEQPYLRAIKAGTGLVGQTGQTDAEAPLSVVLFDEIEKAHPAIWNGMLGILEDGRLTLGDNTTTDFTHSIILMTSNAGSREMGALLEHRPIGFRFRSATPSQPDAPTLRQTALAAARELFPLELLNRFDQTLVYAPLGRQHLERILEKFLAEIHLRALQQARVPMLVRVSPDARELVIDRGTDYLLGARPLRRVVEAELVDPLSRLIAGQRIEAGDIIDVEREGDRLAFYRTSSGDRAIIVL